jgi:microcystin-dependent protein
VSSRDEGIVDVERRKTDAEYTLGDPTVFPPEFLVWLKRFIEQSGIQLPASSIFGTFSPGTGSVRNLAAGIVIPFAGATAPPGSLPCNGQSVSRLTYPGLFEAIGTTYGAVDINSFSLPDYRDRALFGIGLTLANLTDNDGRPMGQRGPSHHHGIALNTDSKGGHSHAGQTNAAGGHSHGGGVDGAGTHGHTFNIAGPNYITRQQGTAGAFFDPVDSLNYSSAGVGGDGGHGHGLHIDGVGDHQHGIVSDGVHTHAVAGNSSGGPGADSPGYHGILYVITLG